MEQFPAEILEAREAEKKSKKRNKPREIFRQEVNFLKKTKRADRRILNYLIFQIKKSFIFKRADRRIYKLVYQNLLD